MSLEIVGVGCRWVKGDLRQYRKIIERLGELRNVHAAEIDGKDAVKITY
jgi:hypothetical protein